MASSDPDAATEALIAQLIAEDFGEAYADQLRPIGSHIGDYEEPITSYQRQCLEYPDMEDGDGGWESLADPPTPTFGPDEDSSTLPEGQTWDSSINEDPRIESTPVEKNTDEDSKTDKDDEKDGGRVTDNVGTNTEQPLHQLHDPIRYHSPDNPILHSPRHVSQPNHALRSPKMTARRNMSDPPGLETTIHDNSNHPPEAMEYSRATPQAPTEPTSPVTTRPPESTSPVNETRPPQPLSPNHSRPHSPIPLANLSAMGPTIATNERLLPFYNSNGELSLDIPASKNKGKDKASAEPSSPNVATTNLTNQDGERMKDTLYADDFDDLSFLDNLNLPSTSLPNPKSKGKGKGKGKAPATSAKRPLPHLGLPFFDLLNDDDHLPLDSASGLPHLRVPWPGSSPGERAFADAMEGLVHEIMVGEEETVESILRDISVGKWGKGVGCY